MMFKNFKKPKPHTKGPYKPKGYFAEKCECELCCDGDHPGLCVECAGWADGRDGGECEYCCATGTCPKCDGANYQMRAIRC